ncbi:MAG: hypothetical protein OHK0024_36740 [Thalassobaculales bacterium]
MSIGDTWTEHLRLTLLRLLADMPGRQANDSLLCAAARRFGVLASRDQVRTALAWLAEQGLLSLSAASLPDGPAITVATLSQRGLDVAHGVAGLPGVARPAPRG